MFDHRLGTERSSGGQPGNKHMKIEQLSIHSRESAVSGAAVEPTFPHCERNARATGSNGQPAQVKPALALFIMVDAMGWEILRHDSFGQDFAPLRKRLDSVFGYSSTCVPSILSGRWPVEHRNWCYFVHDPRNSPFRSLRPLRWLPRALTSRRIFRRWLTKLVRAQLKFRGYFDLYNIPFRHIHQYDFTEKRSPLQPGGMNRGENIFDFLVAQHTPYFVSDPAQSEEQNRDALLAQLGEGQVEFAFLYWPGLDGLLHRVGNDSPEIPAKLRVYEQWIQQLLAAARGRYEAVQLYVFSDHGMANCDEHVDLMRRIEALPLRMERDYAVVYDSTMARFWFFNVRARPHHRRAQTCATGPHRARRRTRTAPHSFYGPVFRRADLPHARRGAHRAKPHGRAPDSRHARLPPIRQAQLRRAAHEPAGHPRHRHRHPAHLRPDEARRVARPENQSRPGGTRSRMTTTATFHCSIEREFDLAG